MLDRGRRDRPRRATLDCYKKEVKLHRPGKLEVKFRGHAESYLPI